MTNENHTQNGIVRTRGHELAAKVESTEPLNGEPTYRHFRSRTLRKRPYRCPQYLEWRWERADTMQEMADEMRCSHSTVAKWLAVFGIRPRGRHEQATTAYQIRNNVDPEDLGLDSVPEPEGSA